MEKIVILENVFKYIKNKRILEDISFFVKKGEIFGILGPDGSGKTTILKIISNLLKPDKGKVEVYGKISFIPSYFNLYPDLKVYENLEFIREIYEIDKNTFLKNKEELLKITKLKEFEKNIAGNLSGGMKKKLLLISGILPNPDIIILDEITTGLDPVSRKEIWEFLMNYKKQKTIIFSTPYFKEGEKAERIIYLKEGKIEYYGSPEEIIEESKTNSLEKAFLKYDRS
jgi:ABC-2 type transport system ATP-binding protein